MLVLELFNLSKLNVFVEVTSFSTIFWSLGSYSIEQSNKLNHQSNWVKHFFSSSVFTFRVLDTMEPLLFVFHCVLVWYCFLDFVFALSVFWYMFSAWDKCPSVGGWQSTRQESSYYTLLHGGQGSEIAEWGIPLIVCLGASCWCKHPLFLWFCLGWVSANLKSAQGLRLFTPFIKLNLVNNPSIFWTEGEM